MDNIIAENLLLVCSICLDSIADYKERSVAKLNCGHLFHLDCIGSAFNIKGAMVCPNCGKTEVGNWVYGNDSAPSLSDSSEDYLTFAENTYEYLVAEEPFGLPSGLTVGHSSFEQEETSSTPNRELPGNYAIFAEHMVASPLAHSHVVHVPPFSSNISDASVNVDVPIFNHFRNGQSVQNELYNLNPFLVENVQYQSWGHYSTPIYANRNHLNGFNHVPVPSTLRTTRVDVDDISRSGPSALPFHYGETSFPRGRSSFVSSFDNPGSITCPHAGHPPQRNPLISPFMPGGRRFSIPTRLPLLAPSLLHSAPPPQGGSNIFPPSGSQNLHEENMGHFSRSPVMSFDRDSGWGSQRQASGGADPGHMSGNFWPQ